ncbi:C40 family peptidase [Neobacillus sp. PS3-34]|uniref:C40 family peptidase n=1 Tax=Neobacillus sp. PS3-34 TaxID=3070678 RepID=UPI0027DFD2A7|nr:C40 family peptidase [Neobacillus sp. PS3-34]WML47022.1 C40 family peptidase [Neobacillus sp. PS3-34]
MRKILMTAIVATTLFISGFAGAGVKNAEAASIGASASNVAKKHIGVPYKWGGITPRGFDCSGLVGYSFKKVGKIVPRTSSQLFRTGRFVSKRNLQKGDLVFFATYKAGASHVGIYLGYNKFIHAASKGVRIDTLSNPYWSKVFYGSKRI